MGFVISRGLLRVANAMVLERVALGERSGVLGIDFADTVETEQAFDERLADHVQLLVDRRAI